ncbi:M28 family metallopeptidase [Nocardia sp. NPDC055053]
MTQRNTTGAAAIDAPTDAEAGMEEVVATLAAMDRRTVGAGERGSAAWLAGRLGELGAEAVTVSTFRGQSSWAPAHLGHVVTAMVIGLLPGRIGRALSLAAAVSYELEVSGRWQWIRRVLPSRPGASVSARLPAAGLPSRTLVLVAHHDAAHNGIVWHPRVVAVNRRWSSRTGRSMPSHLVPLAAMLAAAVPVVPVRRAAAIVLGIASLAMTQSMRSYTTPGANDNATGVAAVLETVRHLRAQPLADTEVIVVFPGGEEAGNQGMRQWVADNRGLRGSGRTLVVNLDSLGSGGHLVLARREGLTSFAARRDVDTVTQIANEAGIELRAVDFPNVCDAAVARHAGMRAISVLSYADGWVEHLHQRSDTADAVGWNTVRAAVTLTEHIARAWDRGAFSNDA